MIIISSIIIITTKGKIIIIQTVTEVKVIIKKF